MLQTIYGLANNELIFVDEIKKIDDGKVIEKHNSMESKTGFFILGAKFAFAKLR